MQPILPLLSLLAVAACAAPPATPLPIEVADVEPAVRGRGVVERACAPCHATGAADSSPNPKAPPLRSLSTRYPAEGLREAFARDMLLGHEGMPEFDFDAGTSHDIVAYLKTIQVK